MRICAPDPESLVATLREVVPDLRLLTTGSPLSAAHTYFATTAPGRELFVKIRTPDDRSADYLARLYTGVRFRSGEDQCVAWHYRGSNGACVVMAGGMAVTKEPATDAFARRFHDAGYSVGTARPSDE